MSAGRRTGRLREALVVAQIALAIVMLTGAGLMLRSFAHLLRVDPGVDVERVLTGRLALPARHSGEGLSAQFFQRLTAALTASPGVEALRLHRFCPLGAPASVWAAFSCSRASRSRRRRAITRRGGTS